MTRWQPASIILLLMARYCHEQRLPAAHVPHSTDAARTTELAARQHMRAGSACGRQDVQSQPRARFHVTSMYIPCCGPTCAPLHSRKRCSRSSSAPQGTSPHGTGCLLRHTQHLPRWLRHRPRLVASQLIVQPHSPADPDSMLPPHQCAALARCNPNQLPHALRLCHIEIEGR
jgi:hypothetical protein